MTALCNFFEERTALFEAMVSWGWDDEDWQEWEQENLSQEELDWIEETENWTDENWITEGDVVRNGVMKKVEVLGHITDTLAPGPQVASFQSASINLHLALVGSQVTNPLSS